MNQTTNLSNQKEVELQTETRLLKPELAVNSAKRDSFSGKISIYIDCLQGYGADKVLVKLANGLVEQGVSVDLIVAQKIVNPNLKIDNLVNVIQLNSSRFNPVKNVVCLLRYIRKNKPECLLSSIHFNNVILASALFLSNTKAKLILRQANVLEQQFKGYPSLVSFILYHLLKLAYKKADLLIAPSQAVAFDMKKYLKAKPDKIKVIHNPTVTLDLFEKAKQDPNHYWFGKNYQIILAVGRLKPQKDFATLLRAFAKVKQNLANAKLIILGEGFLRQELQNLAIQLKIEQDVDLAGFKKNPYPFIAKADLFVSSSVYEGLPNVLIEAFALNQRIIATNSNGGSAEILQNGLYGELVPVENPDLMAEAIERNLTGGSRILKEPRPKHIFNQTSQVNEYIATIEQLCK